MWTMPYVVIGILRLDFFFQLCVMLTETLKLGQIGFIVCLLITYKFRKTTKDKSIKCMTIIFSSQ